ncbi:MAG TPA: hypothetical protein VFZ99_04360 [Terriglobales bacterium]
MKASARIQEQLRWPKLAALRARRHIRALPPAAVLRRQRLALPVLMRVMRASIG